MAKILRPEFGKEQYDTVKHDSCNILYHVMHTASPTDDGRVFLVRAIGYLIGAVDYKKAPSAVANYWLAEYGVAQFLVDYNGRGVWTHG